MLYKLNYKMATLIRREWDTTSTSPKIFLKIRITRKGELEIEEQAQEEQKQEKKNRRKKKRERMKKDKGGEQKEEIKNKKITRSLQNIFLRFKEIQSTMFK